MTSSAPRRARRASRPAPTRSSSPRRSACRIELGGSVGDRGEVAKPGRDQRQAPGRGLPCGRARARAASRVLGLASAPASGRPGSLGGVLGELLGVAPDGGGGGLGGLLGGVGQAAPRRPGEPSRRGGREQRLDRRREASGPARRSGSAPPRCRRRESRAAARRSSADSPSPARPASTRSGGGRSKRTSTQRERTVSSSASGSALIRSRWANGAGSSSVFRSAF